MDSKFPALETTAPDGPASEALSISSLRKRLVWRSISLLLWLATGGFLAWLIGDFNKTYGQPVVALSPSAIFGLFNVSTIVLGFLAYRPLIKRKQAKNEAAASDAVPVRTDLGRFESQVVKS